MRIRTASEDVILDKAFPRMDDGAIPGRDMRVTSKVRFAIVPEWIITHSDLSAQAVRTYALLAKVANNDAVVRITRTKIAEKTCTSLATVKRTLVELQSIGALTVEQVPGAPSTYTLQVEEPKRLTYEPLEKGTRLTDEPGVGSPMTLPRLTDEPTNNTKTYTETKNRKPSKDERLTHEPVLRDELFEAVAEECYGTFRNITTSERGRCNRACAELRRIGASPPEVRERAARVRERGWELTPQTLVNNWNVLSRPPPDDQRALGRPPSRFIQAARRVREEETQQHEEERGTGNLGLPGGGIREPP